MAKSVHFEIEAREGLKKGIDIVARSVRITLGPKGRNVLLEKKYGASAVTNASIAAMILTTQAVITEIPETNGNGMGNGMSPDMM